MDETMPGDPDFDRTEGHDPALDEQETMPAARPVPDAEETVLRAEAASEEPTDDTPMPGGDSAQPSTGGSAPATRLVLAGCGGLLALAAIVAAIVLLATGGLGWTTLTSRDPIATHPDGLSIILEGDKRLRVKLGSVPRETFLQGEAGDMLVEARDNLPAYLQIKSPLYTVQVRGEGASLIELAIPNDSQPYETLSLYRWDEEQGRWLFVPSHVDAAAQVIRTSERPERVAVFQVQAVTPLISTTIEEGQVLTDISASTLNMVFPTGITLRQDGALEGALLGGWQIGAGYAVLPVIRSEDPAVLSNVLNNEATRALHIDDVTAFVVGDGYNGVAVDYRAVDPGDREAFTTFIEELGAALDAQNKTLAVFVPMAGGEPGAWDTGGYDWRAVGAASDIFVISGDLDPASYAAGGRALQMLNWAAGEVERLKIHLAFSSLSVRETGDGLKTIGYDNALEPLGGIALTNANPDGSDRYPPNTSLTFDLNGGIQDFTADQFTGTYSYTAQGENGPRRYWVVTANTIRLRMDLVSTYHIGGLMIRDMLDGRNDGGLLTAVNEFKASAASTVPNQMLIQWTVSGASGAVLSESTGIGTPLVWQASERGDYVIQANIVGGRVSDRGAVAVRVRPEQDETPAPSATPRPNNSNNNNNNSNRTPTPAPTQSAPPPPSGSAGNPGGSFELGGQVPNTLAVANYMQQAGMTWVKFQAKWPYVDAATACSYVASGHAAGFKVLLSIPGPLYPSSIDFGAYTEHLRAVAGCQPDAIEVWNEMNLDREWPAGQLDPASYVNNMLAPGFNAIKSVSPGTIVIIGALAPTGFDNGTNAWSDQRYLQGIAAAGGANYANCVGAHHNSGTTAPSVRSGRSEGDHYSWYFLPTIEVTYNAMGGSLPVCITEFGYLTPEGYGPLPTAFSWGAGNTVAEQAAWLKEGADIARGLGWVRFMIVWNVGFSTYDSDPQAGYSIIRPDGSCPACDLLP